jgi:hypothetical protein
MKSHNHEPVVILFITGVFLAVMTGWVFPEIREWGRESSGNDTVVAAVPADTLEDVVIPVADSLAAALNDTSPAGDSWVGMDPFFEALHALPAENTAVHVAFFGDSMIEGDLLTHPLRRYLQSKFGGHGVGFVPVTTPLPGFRVTVKQQFNDGWTLCSFIDPCTADSVAPGLSGYAYRPSAGAMAEFTTGAGYPPFHRASILFGGKEPIALTIATDSVSEEVTLTPGDPVAAYTVNRDTAFSTLTLRVRESSKGVLYGVNLAYGRGVYVDNYAFRGNSGLPLATIPPALFSSFNRTLNNRLIILNFGLNVYVPGTMDYGWYEASLRRVVRHVKHASPGCAVLIVSMPDRATLINGSFQTPDGLPEFIRMQQRVARLEQVAFFNLFAAMGGVNSMKKWVEDRPKMAADDYTHPNSIGATRFATLLFNFLMTGYDKYHIASDSVPAMHQPVN